MSSLIQVPTISTDVLTTGSTHRFKMTAKRNGVVWDLTDATITLKLRDPIGTRHSHTGAVSLPLEGQAYFDCDTTLLFAGDWQRSWRIQQGTIDITCLPIAFIVTDSPE